MSTYLLSWNPDRYRWDELPKLVKKIGKSGAAPFAWSCGVTRRIEAGDRVFMVKLGTEPRGLIGSGYVTRGSYQGKHWDSWEAGADTAWYVDVNWDVLAASPVIPHPLLTSQFSEQNWSPQASGISIDSGIALALEQEWARRTGTSAERLPDEIDAPTYPEGAVHRVTVNAYERNPVARAACIAHYGARCSVCDIDFEERYGRIGRGFIHVHHIEPLAMRSKSYRVNPIRDLRPVCPNCHAMLHRASPPYKVEALAKKLRS